MLVSLTLPKPLAAVIGLEAGRRGMTVASFITDRLCDAYAMRPPAPSATRCPILPTDDTTDNDDTHD